MESTPRARSARQPLSLDVIVEAGMRIADSDGLSAVSIRRVAAELSARPMSLYSFIDSKGDLVARMRDAVMARMLLDEIPGDWREAMLAIARRTIEVGTKHPWIIAAGFESDVPGPHTLAHATLTLGALSSRGVSEGRAQRLATAVDVYTIGFATLSVAGSGAPMDDRVFTDGITWLLDGFEREVAGPGDDPR